MEHKDASSLFENPNNDPSIDEVERYFAMTLPSMDRYQFGTSVDSPKFGESVKNSFEKVSFGIDNTSEKAKAADLFLERNDIDNIYNKDNPSKNDFIHGKKMANSKKRTKWNQ